MSATIAQFVPSAGGRYPTADVPLMETPTEMVMPDPAAIREFLAFWASVTGVPHITLTAIAPDTGLISTQTFNSGDLDAVCQWILENQRDQKGIYFQPNETPPGCIRKPAKADMVAALCRHADIDPQDDQFEFTTERERLTKLANHLAADAQFPPTVIIDSGNGIQPIWVVEREPLTPSDVNRVEAQSAKIGDALGADRAYNIDRLLRLPGTVNFPNEPKRRRGRGLSRARTIHRSATVYTPTQAAALADHLSGYLSATDLVRLKPKKVDAAKPTGSGTNDEIATLIDDLRDYRADAVTQLDQLPSELQARLRDAQRRRPNLADRWAGMIDDLTESGRDDTRSGVDMSLSGMLRHAGFDHRDTALILCAFPHGKANGDGWPSPEARLRHVARCAVNAYAPEPAVSPESDSVRAHKFTDESLAREFTAKHADKLRYVTESGKWLIREPEVWRTDKTQEAFDLARAICRKASARSGNQSTATRIASLKTIAAVERLARADRQHAVTLEQFDADPWSLNTPEGVVDLKTGRLRAHRSDDYFTKMTAVAPGGDCPTWRGFLDRITSANTELQSYLQRVAGYCLTGSTREQALFFGYGTGANGKSTFINTLTGILDEYGTVAPMDTFTASKYERHPTDVAMLRGARLVSSQETEEGRNWAENKIKSLTGGDPISARYMRQNFFKYTPQFKLFIVGNHKPGLRNVDEAMRRRLNLIPFEVEIPRDERDPDLPEKLRAEWPVILKWMIVGCLDWQKIGLVQPSGVSSATQEYLQSEDALALWIEERCVTGGRSNTESTSLFEDWKQWAIKAGEEPGSQKRFSLALQGRHFQKNKGGNGGRVAFAGIKLRADDEAHRDLKNPWI